jgi:hypothetical protein
MSAPRTTRPQTTPPQPIPAQPAEARTRPEDGHPPTEQMVRLLSGFQVSQALYVIARLDVATALLDGPLPVADLAARTGADEQALRRVLRALTGLGLFSTAGPDTVAVTALGRTLAAGVPGSVRDLALTWMETHYAPFGELVETVRDGVPAATRFYGRPFFEWLAGDPEQVAQFTRAMAGLTSGIGAAAIDGYVVPGGPVVVDVGGADGTLLLGLLEADPDPARRGVVLDLPHVVDSAREKVAASPLADRVEVVAGDFRTAVPAGDAYVLSAVLHDWDDDAATRILRNIAAAASPGARLAAMELVLPPDDSPHLGRMIDLTMLGMLGGRERTATEFADLLAAGGFRLDRVLPTAGERSVIEATLAG